MTIPAPLAFPPTALRNVAAGLVVGNPVGSSGTRAKALTSAELKAIVEASGISYLPLSGGTLTGPITGTGGLIEQRDGLTAQCFDLFETYTSGTNNGKLRFKATSSGHQIGSARAASGSNRAVQLGHFDSAGAFTAGLSIATNGTVQANNINSGGNGYVLFGNVASNRGLHLSDGGQSASCSQTWVLNFSSTDNTSATKTAKFGRNANATPICVWADEGFRVRNYADTADGPLICGQITHVPPTSTITLSTNGHFSIEMTSNTAGNLVYRGSDGTTRRMALTFS